tara:strand:+ start:445 stop:687 length:243 start_codon:yes stop_codon:yes gene_type:complete
MSVSLLKALKAVCLENEQEKLYIANSEKITELIVQLFMSDFYPNIQGDKALQDRCQKQIKISDEKVTSQKEKQFEKMIWI